MNLEITLAEIRDRADLALDGPWRANGLYVVGPARQVIGAAGAADIEFIAHARQDVPRLLAAVEAALGMYRMGVKGDEGPTTLAEIRGYNQCLDETERAIAAALNGENHAR